MTFNTKTILFIAVTFALLQACGPHVDAETKQANQKADSLSIKLNSPELKAVNADLLNDPNNPELYNKRASIYISLKQFPEAEGDAKRAIKIDSNKVEYWLTLADANFVQNRTRFAKEYLERTTKKFPENTEALLKLAELYFLVKQYQLALDYSNKALKINDNLAQAYYLKGNIYKESGDTTRAISSMETAVEQDSKFENAFVDLGLIYAARKNPIAMDYYNNALKLNPNNEYVQYARARLLQDLGKIDEAVLAYENLAKKKTDCFNCYYNLGAIYFEIKKDNLKALECFTRAIALNPEYTEAYFARGLLYARMKDKVSAKADYDMCLKLQPNYAPAAEGLNALPK
jgi:tetratricopeptide (TPR) repeat protein